MTGPARPQGRIRFGGWSGSPAFPVKQGLGRAARIFFSVDRRSRLAYRFQRPIIDGMGQMGKGTTLAIELKREEGEPIFLTLARSIVAEVERGRLRPGDPLPGTRALSRELKLNRNTVDAAYHELLMQGWLTAEASRGTFVARDLPDLGQRHRPETPVLGVSTCRAKRRAAVDLSTGTPDPRLAPTVALGQALRRALVSPAFLRAKGYGDPHGAPALRDALATYLKEERGLAVSPERLLVTRGSQMALFLAAAAAVEPGMAIAVEDPGYPLAWAAFRAAGARVVAIPVDEGGVDPDALDRLAQHTGSLRAVYVTPHHQYPTTVTLGAARRLRLLDLARRHRLTIIEDDYDHEYRFDGRAILPLAARADEDVDIIYVGSLSKLLAPGIRVGYAAAAPSLLRRMANRREAIDRQGDVPLEQAVCDLLADGTMRRHARKARRVYLARRDHAVDLLRSRFGRVADFDVPAGGLAIWLRLRPGVSAERWMDSAAQLGLQLNPGARLSLDSVRPPEAFRLGFAALDEEEFSAACELMARACPGTIGP